MIPSHIMKNLRKYGKAPFVMVVVHGGPGAAGEMAPVARELASRWGVLEPMQTASSLEGQIEELRSVLEEHGDLPVTLIGFSWGAWLGYRLAARYPALVKKLILVGSGPFEEKYAAGIQAIRFGRLGIEERAEVLSLIQALKNPAAEEKSAAFARFGALFSKADAFDPIGSEEEAIDFRADIFERVWKEGAELRRSGELLKAGKHIQCPVVAIHGDYDPHPSEGVRKPLSAVLKRFRLILLEHCGHRPWMEKEAREAFYQILKAELQ
jgi:pimeloyl-ACP methyl ester carboxylesterase